jgi:hypothetical protein
MIILANILIVIGATYTYKGFYKLLVVMLDAHLRNSNDQSVELTYPNFRNGWSIAMLVIGILLLIQYS